MTGLSGEPPKAGGRIRVVVSDPLAADGLAVLEAAGIFDLVSVRGADRAPFHEALASAEALLVRSGTKVTREVVDAAPRLKLVGRAGTGVDNIDVEACTRRGIVVMNTPDANSIAAAEHTLALMLALARNVVPAAVSLAAGRWERARFMGTELAGKTLGVVGFGRIGREVARRARAFRMTVLVHDPFVSDEAARKHEAEAVGLDDLLARADVVTLHAPLTAATRHLIGARELGLMKRGARLVNCARGGLVDEAALNVALESGHLAGAALDVFEKEPPDGSPLPGRPDVVATPHLGASTREAQESVASELAGQVRDYFLTGAIRNAVNMPALSAEAYREAGPYLDLAERLGTIAGTLAAGRIESLAFEYLGDAAQQPLPAMTLAGLKGCLSTRAGESVNFVNARVMAAELGIAVEESFHPGVEDYTNLLRVTLRAETGALTLAGSLLRRNQPRLVAVAGYELDATPAGHLIILENDDVPGVAGMIGTLLGDAGINIARLYWGSEPERKTALTVIRVDPRPDERVLERMAAEPRVRWLKAVDLPPISAVSASACSSNAN